MKHKIISYAIIIMALALPQRMLAYDFSAVAPSGQTLYYSIIDGSSVAVTYPGSESSRWGGYATPSGHLIIPSSVSSGGNTYTVSSIGYNAFSFFCRNLTAVTIPYTITTISQSFIYCDRLASIIVEDGNTCFDSRDNCNAIIETTTNKLIVGCKNTIIPNTVTCIGIRAFSGHSGLRSINIPGSVTAIDNFAFDGCKGLTSIFIPNSVSTIGSRPFSDCSGLSSIVVEAGNMYYDSRDNSNAIIHTSSNTLLVGCQNTTIPNSVTRIGDYAFCGCTRLTTLTIPNSVTSIGSGVFQACENLTSITIPNSVTSIGSLVFNGCIGLTTITIGSSLSYIGFLAFACRSNLEEITCLAPVAPTIQYSAAWEGVPTDVPVHIPCGSLASYQTTEGWSFFTNYQEMPCPPAPGLQIRTCSGQTLLFSVDEDSRTATVTGYVAPCEGALMVPPYFEVDGVRYTVTAVGERAFEGCTGLTMLTLPASITTVGEGAFSGCSHLQDVKMW